jgi:hypothetical protein
LEFLWLLEKREIKRICVSLKKIFLVSEYTYKLDKVGSKFTTVSSCLRSSTASLFFESISKQRSIFSRALLLNPILFSAKACLQY